VPNRIHRDWDQPLPTGKRFAFIGKSGSVAQRARVTLVAPAFACCFAPDLEIDWHHDKLAHRRHFDGFQLACRELVLRIEFAQRVDRVAEKLEPHGSFSSGWPNVDDAAPH